MVQLIDPETAFWIIVDAVLASLVIYASVKYVKLKKRTSWSDARPNIMRNGLTSKFREYVSNYGGRQAVIKIFNELVDGLATVNQLNAKRSLTTKEILTTLNSGLSGETQKLLDKMYSLYEATRFGGHEPSELEVSQFSDWLETLDKLFTRLNSSRWFDES